MAQGQTARIVVEGHGNRKRLTTGGHCGRSGKAARDEASWPRCYKRTQEDGQEVERNGTDSYNEVIFGRRRSDSVVVDWANKVLFVLEFKRTSDQRRDYRERGGSRARTQHDILIKSLERVAKDAEGENGVWKIRLIIFVGGTCGSVNVKS